MVLIGAVAFIASALTFVSGFGLGTLLMPVFALFFPIQTAVAATAVVHLANNLFKLALVRRAADWHVVMRFGGPATVAAMAGAGVLVASTGLEPWAQYELWGRPRQITMMKVIVGTLTVTFALLESGTRFRSMPLPVRYLPWGGVLAGFLGGLSGIQGALRSAFLLKAGLDAPAFVATGVVCAVLVDLARLLVYGGSQVWAQVDTVAADAMPAVVAATLCAFAGALLGARVLTHLTLRAVQVVVSVMLTVIGVALATGLL